MAFALFPALSNAQDSSGVQYRDAPPTVTGKPSQKDSGSSPNTGDGQDGSQSPTRPGSKGDDRDGEAGGATGKKGDDEGGAAPGKGGKGQGGDGEGGAAAAPLETDPAAGTDDGGSPLVPILIALAVLAAISVGAVVMRRRREDTDPGSPVSPNAG
jgi:hypothetical protein